MKPEIKKHIVILVYVMLAFVMINTVIERQAMGSAEVSANSQICLETCQIQQRQAEGYVTQELGLPKTTIEDKAHTLAQCHSRCLRNILITQDSTGL